MVNLERVNLGDLDAGLVTEAVDVVTIDVSYLSLTAAVPQLERVVIAAAADLIALVKPMFELHLPCPPEDAGSLRRALDQATRAIASGPWQVLSSIESPVRGARGAIEFLVHARRRSILERP